MLIWGGTPVKTHSAIVPIGHLYLDIYCSLHTLYTRTCITCVHTSIIELLSGRLSVELCIMGVYCVSLCSCNLVYTTLSICIFLISFLRLPSHYSLFTLSTSVTHLRWEILGYDRIHGVYIGINIGWLLVG